MSGPKKGLALVSEYDYHNRTMSSLTPALPNPEAQLAFDLRPLLRLSRASQGSSGPSFRGSSLQRWEDQEMTALRESAFPLRTRMFDEEVSTFLLLHPGGTVVQLGGRVRSRFLRLDNGIAHWVDIDREHRPSGASVPVQDSARVQQLSVDFTIGAWTRHIASMPGPHCFVLGSRPGCFRDNDLDLVVQALKAHFPRAWLVLDVCGSNASQAMNEAQLVQLLIHTCGSTREGGFKRQLERLGVVVDRSRTLLDRADLLLNSLSGLQKLWVRRFPVRYRARFLDYQVLRVVLP